uniref:Translation initiation factor IF-3 n=1 Tax=Wildemania schizophylla TaxID=1134705 RepID=A0A126G1V3_WILSC|nr:translation initiation factor 3 [Wildemania schizophylla]AKS28374.1 translation initiation factor 3 [Wildemania schizophylla]
MLEKHKNSKKFSRDLPQINDRIRFPKVRVIDDEGDQLGIFAPEDAIQLAIKQDLDLVVVSDKSDPPVCRILDYGKYKFTQEKRAREAKKKQHNSSIKEVKMRYKIEEHDYKVRINQASKFLQSGDKVKATITFRGREIQHSNLAIELLNKMATDLNSISEIQQFPSRDGRNVIMLLSPKKVG